MKHLSLLIPNGHINLSSVIGTYKILSRANEYYQERHNRKIFDLHLVGNTHTVSIYEGLFSIHPEILISQVNHTDFIIVPSLNHDIENVIYSNQSMIAWIHQQVGEGAEAASICTGSFLLAAAGVLEGKQCSTHWSAAAQFRKKYPLLNLVEDKIITDEHGIYTSGGAFSFLNFLLYLVEKYYDRETAIYCSKVFQIDMNRDTQNTYVIFQGQKSHNDEIIRQAQYMIETKLQDRFSMEELAQSLALSRRNFDRRFIKATGNTPLLYQQRVKIEAAKRMLENTKMSVNEVMLEVGYTDVKAFREVFKKIAGISPIDYRARYGMDKLATNFS
ncbi:AraC family transcriptional regulator [Chitinophaga caeni]|uniref:AraC family transcriptional regulator n=1 Tax=Chitinophaga caeni TaxID=2029983 RepID=A0A291QXY1_9BACT|nr:helix-turn-helix domain-containing protein [Chitinophaga caeni]ATL48723.1 AraC family transcriptional regulator [Chitinophaga caeni]